MKTFVCSVIVLVETLPLVGLQMKEEEGWVSFKYNSKEKRPAFAYNITKQPSQSVRFVTKVVPYFAEVPAIEVINLQQAAITNDIRLLLKQNGKEKKSI